MSNENILLFSTIGGINYSEEDRLDISNQTEVTIAFNQSTIFLGAMINPDSNIAFKWDGSGSATISKVNSLRLPANGVHQLLIPPNIQAQNTLSVLHLKQVISADKKFIRYAKI